MLKIHKLVYQKSIYRNISSLFYSKTLFESEKCIRLPKKFAFVSINLSQYYPQSTLCYTQGTNFDSQLYTRRYFSKKKGAKKRFTEAEEDSDSEDDESYESYEPASTDNISTKSLPSMRLDTIVKAGLGITKKKVEQSFYANKIRLNGKRILKKAVNVSVGSEIDLVKGFSPDNDKFLLVDRIIVNSVGKVTATGNYPIKMEILKALTIENYAEPWNPSSLQEIE